MVNKNFRSYKVSDSIAFRSTKGEFGGLSNMAGGYPILIDRTWIKTSEALYQALKFPMHPEIQQHIIHVSSPMFAKDVSIKNELYIRKDWHKIKYKVMRYCLEKKLENNFSRFSELLLSTGKKQIVEYSQKDQTWGASLSNDEYNGINALGRLLMELRNKVKEEGKSFTNSELSVNSFLLFGKSLI